MEGIKSKIYLTWDDIDALVNVLTIEIINKHPQIDSIAGLPRGGLIPAVMLSHKLNLPLVSEPTRKTLIVDDICDSGETFLKLLKQHPFNLFACLHYKPHTSKFLPDIWAELYEVDNWLVYPWENENADAIQDYLK
jgi:hypoxanthine phosphoribosyltransferase